MRKGSVFGLLGILTITLGIIISILFYEGRVGEKFSFLNHYVSELGESPWSIASWVFNTGLIAGGSLVLFFMITLWPVFDTWIGKLIVVMGIITSISGGLVGVYPMNHLVPHVNVALTFFYSGLLVTILFSLYVFTNQNQFFPKWMAVPGLVSFVCFFSFLFLTDPIVPEGEPLKDVLFVLENRPAILETAIFEWAVILSTLIWIFVLAVFVNRNTRMLLVSHDKGNS